jgi:DNA-binding NarL/FixJ family response regulator
VIRVLIADDHAIVRGGLKEILVRHLEGAECGEAENAQQVLAQVQRHPWDVLILDITMPGKEARRFGSSMEGRRRNSGSRLERCPPTAKSLPRRLLEFPRPDPPSQSG